MTKDAKPLRADPAWFTLDAHSAGRSRWFYASPHPLGALLEDGYFDGARDHKPRRGDLITAIHVAPDQPIEKAELIVTVGTDRLGPNGQRLPIKVEPSGPAYRETPSRED